MVYRVIFSNCTEGICNLYNSCRLCSWFLFKRLKLNLLQCLLSGCDCCISNTAQRQLRIKSFEAFEVLDDSLKKALPPVPVLLLVTLRWQVTPIQALCTQYGRVWCSFLQTFLRYKMLPSRASFLKETARILILLSTRQ